jgi:hypothetical protein
MATESSTPSAPAAAAPAATTKPVKPDEEAYKKEHARLEKENDIAREKLVGAQFEISVNWLCGDAVCSTPAIGLQY